MKILVFAAAIAVLLCIQWKKADAVYCGINVSCDGIKRNAALTDGCKVCWCLFRRGLEPRRFCANTPCRNVTGDKADYCRRVHEANNRSVTAARRVKPYDGPFYCGVRVSCARITQTVVLSDGCNDCTCSVSPIGVVHGPRCTRLPCYGGPGQKERFCRKIFKDNVKKVNAVSAGPYNCGINVTCDGVRNRVRLSDGCNGCWCSPDQANRTNVPGCTRMACADANGRGNKQKFCEWVHANNVRAIALAKMQ